MHKILFIDHYSYIYGSENSLFELLSKIDRNRFLPVVALPTDGPLLQKISKLGIKCERTPLSQLKLRNPLPYLATVLGLLWLIHKHEINLIHTNVDIATQYALPAARITRRPIISFTRNFLSPRGFRRMFLGYSDVLIANSRAVMGTYLPPKNTRQKRHVIHNAIDPEVYRPLSSNNGFRSKWGIPSDSFIIAVVGRITPPKAQHIFLEALARIKEQLPQFHALIVGDTQIEGDDWYLENLKDFVHKSGLAENVTFTGYIGEIIPLLNSIDLMVLPTLKEPFGRILIEAMAMKKPVISVARGGPLEILQDGVTGIFVPPKDAQSLAEAILRIINDRALAKRLGENGRKRVKAFFDIRENVFKIEQIYLEVLNSSSKKIARDKNVWCKSN